MPTDLGSIKLPVEIPGFLTTYELMCLAHLSRYIPENKQVLEIGSLFGRSSLTFLMNSHKSVIVNSIDSFELYGSLESWVKEYFLTASGEKNLKKIAAELTIKNSRFLEGFKYFTKEYRESKRLTLRQEKSQDSDYDIKSEVMFVDGDHYIVTEDVLKFNHLIDGLIIIHDLIPLTEYGCAVFKSVIECRDYFNTPFIVFPKTSFVFFYKTEKWKDILFEVFEKTNKTMSEWSET